VWRQHPAAREAFAAARTCRPLGLHLAAVLVLVLALIAAFVGVLVGVVAFEPGGLFPSDSEQLSTEPITTAHYLGEFAFAAVPALLVCSLLLPVVRAAGSPAPTLRLRRWCCCRSPRSRCSSSTAGSRTARRAVAAPARVSRGVWDLWIATAAAVVTSSLALSCWAVRTGRTRR
jgi:hypothetical protein